MLNPSGKIYGVREKSTGSGFYESTFFAFAQNLRARPLRPLIVDLPRLARRRNGFQLCSTSWSGLAANSFRVSLSLLDNISQNDRANELVSIGLPLRVAPEHRGRKYRAHSPHHCCTSTFSEFRKRGIAADRISKRKGMRWICSIHWLASGTSPIPRCRSRSKIPRLAASLLQTCKMMT
jgi:hypothetical protein